MWPNPLLYDVVIDYVSPAAVAATSDIDSAVLDMSGYDGVLFLALFGDVTNACVASVHAYENTASSTSSPSPTEIGTAGTPDFTASATSLDSKIIALDVKGVSMTKRYIFARLHRATQNAVVNGIVSIRYRARKLPVTASTDVVASNTI